MLRSKSATDVYHSLLHLLVKYYGPPVLISINFGREFDNYLIQQFADGYGITLHCSPEGSH